MDHDTVRAGLYEGKGTLECIFHTLLEDQALDTGDDHEIIGELCFFTGSDLLGELLDRRLGLLHLSTEERILLKACLILDDDCGNAESLKRSDSIYEVLGKSACITVKDDRLGGNFGDILDRSETGGHIDELDVRLTLRSTVAEGAYPHRVKLVELTFVLYYGLLYDKTGKAAVCLHRLYDRSHLDQLS